MSSFFDRMLGRNPKGSSSTAKDRLQFVLVHDRINLPPERMQEMKEEILAVISKYVPVDTNSVDIALEQRDRNNSALVAEIPVIGQQRGSAPIDQAGHDNDDLKGARPKSDMGDEDNKKESPEKVKAEKTNDTTEAIESDDSSSSDDKKESEETDTSNKK